VDEEHNRYGDEFIEEDTDRERQEFAKLTCPPVTLTEQQRNMIESAMREACTFRQWFLYEINVRTNHVHVVVTADEPPKTIIEKLKTRATMALRSQSRDRKTANQPLWTRGGSGRYLWNDDAVQAACKYVREQ
jgi:REP element-mobilizing transposase RayT